MTETHDIPKWIEERVTHLGGLNRFGKPMFRVIWGGNRTYIVGGMFNDVIYIKDENGNSRGVVTRVADIRTLLKYHPNRYHLEKWCDPIWYGTPETWYQNTWDDEAKLHTMGDYPADGDYEHVFFLGMCNHMGPKDTEWCNICKVNCGEFIPLEENFFLIERQIKMLIMSQTVNPLAERSALFGREAQHRQERRKQIQEIVEEAMRPTLALQPTSWQSGTNSRTSVPEPKSGSVNEIMLRRHGEGFRQGKPRLP